MTTAAEFQAKVTKGSTNFDRLDAIVNGDASTTVVTDGGTVPSLAKVIAETGYTGTSAADAAASAAEAETQVGLATTQAGIATTKAAEASAIVVGAPQNGGQGTVLDNGTSPLNIIIPASKSRAVAIYTESADGTKGDLILSLDTVNKRVAVSSIYASGRSFVDDTMVMRRIENSDPFQPFVMDGKAVFAVPDGERFAWGVPGFFLDTKSWVLRGTKTVFRPAGVGHDTNAIVSRGDNLGFRKLTRPVQIRTNEGAYFPQIVQGAAMESKGLRTHQLIPAFTRSGKYLYAMFDAASNTLGTGYSGDWTVGPEAVNSYCVLMRRPVTGGTWVEVAQFRANTPAVGRTAIPRIRHINGRVVVLWTHTALGTRIHDYSLATWCSTLENPDAIDQTKLVFSKPRFIGYGFPGTLFEALGDVYGMLDVWHFSGTVDATYDKFGKKAIADLGAEIGSHLVRYKFDGPGSPYVEYLSRQPYEADSAKESYSESQAAMLNGGGFLCFRRSVDGIRKLTVDADLTAWTGPTDYRTETNVLTAVRTDLFRTATGNLALIGNFGSGSRTNMGLRLSTDEGVTWGHEVRVDTSFVGSGTSYPSGTSWIDPTTGRSKIGWAYDNGRGTGAGIPADIIYVELFEDEVLADTIGTAGAGAWRETDASYREFISQLAYTGV